MHLLVVLCLLAAAATGEVAEPSPSASPSTSPSISPSDSPSDSPVILGLVGGEAAAGRSVGEVPEPQRRYDGHAVLRVVPRTLDDMTALEKVLANISEVDVWRPPSRIGEEVHLRVPPIRLDSVIGDLEGHGLQHGVLIQDVQRLIENQTQVSSHTGLDRHSNFGFEDYYRIDDIYVWMHSLVEKSGGAASVVTGGLTTEGRHILGVRLAHAPDLPVVILEGGVHGREWASTAATAFVLQQLVASEDPEVRRLARAFEWHVFPSVNPDGYEYSHTTDRLWSKSRARNTLRCYGADLNRNFPHQWGTTGVSWDICSNQYPGTRAASEIETRTRMAYMKPLLRRTKAVIALHNYGQYLLFPWGHTTSRDAKHDALMEVASKSAEAFAKRHGTRLTTGSWAEMFYPVSGTLMDWAHSRAVPYTFTFQLRDRGESGFLLPADQIVPASEETLDGIVGLLNAIP